jgi:hypothetical protein
MDRRTSKRDFTTGMIYGVGAAAIFALTFFIATLYLA